MSLDMVPNNAQLLKEFWEWVDSCYGIYLDASDGFPFVQADRQTLLKQASAGLDVPVSLATFSYARLQKQGAPPPRHLHTVDMGKVIERNALGGQNTVFIGRMTIVAIYSFWEDHTRKKIEEPLKLEGKRIQIPLMGEVMLLRNLILHHGAKDDGRLKQLAMLEGYPLGGLISPTKPQIEQLVDKLREMIDCFGQSPEQFIKPQI